LDMPVIFRLYKAKNFSIAELRYNFSTQ